MIIVGVAAIALQFTTAVVALMAFRESGRHLTWLLVACAFVLMGGQGLITLVPALATPESHTLSLTSELIGLSVSALLLGAAFGMRSWFLDAMRARKRAQRERRKFQQLAESASDWFWETDENHCYTWFSERVEEITGFSREWHYGRSRIELCQPGQPTEAWQKHLEQLAAREPFRDVEIHRVAPDGERWIRSTGVPMFDDSGRFRGYRGTGTDITEWKRAEQAYAAVCDQLNKAINSMSEGLIIFGPDDRLVLCNDRMRRHNPWITDDMVPGITFEEMVDLIGSHALPNDLSPEQRAAWRAERLSLRERPNATMEFQVKSGAWCRVASYRIEDGSTVLVRTDITELKQRQAELEQERNRAEAASCAKTEFLANMSHELRTPLNAIIGFADLMSSGIAGDVPQRFRSYSDDIAMSGRHLLDLINDLLDLAKIETGQIDLSEEEFDLAPELSDILVMVSPQRDEKRIRLKEDLTKLAPGTLVYADRRAFRQILINLFSNAVKYTPAGGSIALRVSAFDGDLEIAVTDSGVGIPAHEQERVFDRFVRVGDVLERGETGAGIGLPLSRSLAELHGGGIELESAGGQGTTVTLHLPGRVRRPPRLAYAVS
ncbi:MAG: ATP-binding protein [Alphaproteobacteria bacterium]|nr:ATP-binding protein [Alphaproteobacteria bacterium]